jgi:hypothetical protein
MDLAAFVTAPDRVSLGAGVVNALGAQAVAEVGVWKGEFAEAMLRRCPGISRYYLIDPWLHLPDWNKPFNVGDEVFAEVKEEALRRTELAGDRSPARMRARKGLARCDSRTAASPRRAFGRPVWRR